jgi:enoyl-CoA hydratase/carnithine racemase
VVGVEQRDGMALITLDRSDRGNALAAADVADLRAAFSGFDSSVGLVAIRGSGGRAFCGGIDAPEIVGMEPDRRRQTIASFLDLCLEIWRHPALTLAVIDGYAIGGGAHLALAADLRFATATSWFQFPAGRYGLGISAAWLGWRIGYGEAMLLLGSADRVDCPRALDLGLVDRSIADPLVDPRQLLGPVPEPAYLRSVKAFVRRSVPVDLASALLEERAWAIEAAGTKSFVEALRGERSARNVR